MNPTVREKKRKNLPTENKCVFTKKLSTLLEAPHGAYIQDKFKRRKVIWKVMAMRSRKISRHDKGILPVFFQEKPILPLIPDH